MTEIVFTILVICAVALASVIWALAFSLKHDQIEDLDTYKTAYWAKHAR